DGRPAQAPGLGVGRGLLRGCLPYLPGAHLLPPELVSVPPLPALGINCWQACCAALNFGSSGPTLPRPELNSWVTWFPLNLGSGMSMPCWRMHLVNASAACLGSLL